MREGKGVTGGKEWRCRCRVFNLHRSVHVRARQRQGREGREDEEERDPERMEGVGSKEVVGGWQGKKEKPSARKTEELRVGQRPGDRGGKGPRMRERGKEWRGDGERASQVYLGSWCWEREPVCEDRRCEGAAQSRKQAPACLPG